MPLGRRIRARQRAVATAVPDPHDDTVSPPLWLRTAKSPASRIEVLVVTMAALVVPIGWVGGHLLMKVVTAVIPKHLRAFPIAALLWCRPAAVISLAVLCGGDGAAEVVGRTLRSPRLPWNSSKVSQRTPDMLSDVRCTLGCGFKSLSAPV